MKKRENYKVVLLEPAKSRIERNECPGCGLPKESWKRRKDWRACSKECTTLYVDSMLYIGWQDLRLKAFKRDNFTCVKCGLNPRRKSHEGATTSDASKLVGDHIIPIALGGEEWDIDNVQTLCLSCNKLKIAEDAKKIGEFRRFEKERKYLLEKRQLGLERFGY